MKGFAKIEPIHDFSRLIPKPEEIVELEAIEDYLLKQFDIDVVAIDSEQKKTFLNNFIFVMSLVIKDLKEIDGRVEVYQREIKRLENDKSNEGEYRRRKYEYFCNINIEARAGITNFLHSNMKDFLYKRHNDMRRRGESKNSLENIFLKGRYKYAEMHQYYDANFDFSTCAKANYFPNIDWLKINEVREEYIKLKKDNPEAFYTKIKDIVDSKGLMDNIAERVECNYYLNQRKNTFDALKDMFNEKNYQAFIALGLLQLEGIFYDFCIVKYGEKENMGTLVEKVKRVFSDNDKMLMFYYPYFAFDIPIMRNEIAHKGLINTNDLERTSYDLVLDLNSVIKMVERESNDKFIIFQMIFSELIKLEDDTPEHMQNLNKKLIEELFGNEFLTQGYFWKMLKNPEIYKDEILFYSAKTQEGYIGLDTIVSSIASLLKKPGFWEALICELQMFEGQTIPKKLYDFAVRMKKDYIGILNGEGKNKCIELSKFLEEHKEEVD